MGNTKKDLSDRFWSKVNVVAFNRCWNWTASKVGIGYGSFNIDGIMKRANRVAWELTNGPIPDGMNALHKCDNPSCCNPRHLFLGSLKDNNDDMKSKGRRSRHGNQGEKNGSCKLTVKSIREIRSDESPVRDIALRFNISSAHVMNIRARRKWAHVQ